MTSMPPLQRVGAIVVAIVAACCGGVRADDGPTTVGTAADRLLPTTVRVASDHTYLRAGPGADFYPTERLAQGAEVEVWALDASGYAAVRPVAGSYSWIRAADVDDEAALDGSESSTPTAPGSRVGVIVVDGAVARIGSQVNDLRHVAQVQLEAGERVRIVEEVRIPSGRHAGLWMRIEPPAGEFRWANLTDLTLPPALAAFVPRSLPADANTGAALAALKDAGAAVAAAVEEVRDAAAPPTPQQAAPPSLTPVPLSQRLFGGWLPMGSGVLEATAQPAAVAVTSGGGAAATDELADIDLALSLAVTGPPDQMNLAPIRERLRVAAAKTTSQADRLRAEAIDARLTRFEAIHGKYQALASTAPADASPLRLGSMWSSLSALGTRPVRPGVLPGGGPADGQPTWTPPSTLETTGRLATVVSRRPDAPRWAIVDDHNTVLVFVTPQAGVNLAPLVGQQVSVRGAQGYMPEYKRPYVVASEARPRLAAAPQINGDLTR